MEELYHLNTEQPTEGVIRDLAYATKNNWMEPIDVIITIRRLLQAEYNNGYKDGYKAGQADLV